ncbi:MAG: hypothetical protein CVU96_00355 [Firmicutes bacterium HGW-Firmicutes-20]|jgi:hypothetical protein|nr:MAG: hypothetical protein CVU96_00355 [Firmicutes bacterium HGW-Firmicutes-20]
MTISDDFDEIMNYAHFWNWLPDWRIVKEIYMSIPNSYSILSPFAYAYLEEIIRSTTSEYGIEILDEDGKPRKRKVGMELIKLAIEENNSENPELVTMLKKLEIYYLKSQATDRGDNRHSVAHGYMHSRFWGKESFEILVHDIALISKYAGF